MINMLQPFKGYENDYPFEKHYRIEKELAEKLKNAGAEERKILYSEVYGNLFQMVPFHISLQRKKNPEFRQKVIQSQLNILGHFIKPDSAFMEIGAGDCELACALAKKVGNIFALDVSQAAINENEFPANFHSVIFDGSHIPFDNNSMDIAYSYQVIEHLHPDDVMVQMYEVLRVLKTGGTFVCVTPNRIFGPHDISKLFDERASGLHLKEYTANELAGILRKSGFKRVKRFVMAGQHQLYLPQFYLKILEDLLDGYSKRTRWKLANFLPIKVLLGGSNIYLMAMK